MAVWMDPYGRFDNGKPIHLWIRWYVFTVMLQAVSETMFTPWVLAFCPLRYDVYRNLSTVATTAAYIATQAILMHVTVLRLKVVASTTAVAWARRLLNVTLLLGAFVCVAFGINESLAQHSSMLAVVIALVTAASLAYASFQCHALIVLALIACEAHKETRVDVHAAVAAKSALVMVALMAASVSTSLFFIVMFISGAITKSLSA